MLPSYGQIPLTCWLPGCLPGNAAGLPFYAACLPTKQLPPLSAVAWRRTPRRHSANRQQSSSLDWTAGWTFSSLDPRCAARAWRQAPSLPSLVVNKITRYQFSTLMGFFFPTPKATFQLISDEFPLETWLCSWDCNDSRHDMLYYCLAVLQGGITSIAPGFAMITFLVCSSMFFGFLSSQKDLDLLRWKAK